MFVNEYGSKTITIADTMTVITIRSNSVNMAPDKNCFMGLFATLNHSFDY